jgi:tryptophan-rich hypothetical protein
VNSINPNKLLNSKWTAIKPLNKEKHFLITEIEFDEKGEITHCLIESVLFKRSESIEWRALKNNENWIQGWK